MSVAGIRSNRGDIYQTLIAFDWALTVLSDPGFEWLEIDSTTYLVDDVAISKSDGSLICCQCKKNQAEFRAWSIVDLAEELDKAFQALTRNKQTQIYFYSRSEFGALAKLREYSTLYGNETDYRKHLTKDHEKTDKDLADLIARQASNLSVYEFLCRTFFMISPDFDRMEDLLHERLRQMASNSNTAFDALWTQLDKLGGRTKGSSMYASVKHRLSKGDLKHILNQAGAMLTPAMSISYVRKSFANISAIGRSWQRDIGGRRISNSVITSILSAINDRQRSILLTGLPGSGKTCVMLELQETLEQRMQIAPEHIPLFIQSREFVDLATTHERRAQGLPEQWVEQAARLAEDTHVVVIIDSLDVLSIAREHSVLMYFLAQIDQLLLIPNVTIITSCRDFDRTYDRRIAARQWDCELKCPPLNWNDEIEPLLISLEIDTSVIDAATRSLISNPRELALFVDLAQREGSFNAITSQALAQRYLETIVRADPALGDTAMHAIEVIAEEMLNTRSLSIPYQRFSASLDIQRRLRSLNVLQYTHDEKLMFGHQTLLDVLLISSSLRKGVSLNAFIQSLPPVPFVRPSIRSFVAQLAAGERREFRKQLRAVLTGNAAFHIRRLVAEVFSQYAPQDDDWPLIRDLRNKHREVFQVIYAQASLIQWHHFWLSHLVPLLKEVQDTDGLIVHVHRVEQWKNEDASSVVTFWMEMLSLDWMDCYRTASRLGLYLNEFKTKNLPLAAPLLERLIRMPNLEHRFFGRAVARCVTTEAMNDQSLWHYIVRDISEDDIRRGYFNDKLHCQPHDFRDKTDCFLKKRMLQSEVLLDLAVTTIEQWSQTQASCYGKTRIGYRNGYLHHTSYSDNHSHTSERYIDGERILLDAIEAAVVDHAKNHTPWWKNNRERLCFNHEGALCYFAVLACTASPEFNLDLIGQLLCDRNLLEFELQFELGTLIKSTFIHFDDATQDAVMATIETIYKEFETEEHDRPWILARRAEYISTIPCHLRPPEAQAILSSCESTYGTLIRQPQIVSSGGIVTVPFSFEIFLNTSDDRIIHLLAHYTDSDRDFNDFLVGGEREVGLELQEAASRQPSRFLSLLTTFWSDISAGFRDEIMIGIANYLAHRFGKMRANSTWIPIEEPDAQTLANQILDELETHYPHWQLNHSTTNALEACAHVIHDTQNASRLVMLAKGFENFKEESVIHGNPDDLLTIGINMMSGKIAEALMILTNNLQEHNIALPELLPDTLRQFACNEHSAVRALVLLYLPPIQNGNPELGWELFKLATHSTTNLWRYAERCLYYAYHDSFELVAPLLACIRHEGSMTDMKTWGRISALSGLTGHIDIAALLKDLNQLKITEAWSGAASVWSHPENIKQHRAQCLAGITAGLKTDAPHAKAVARRVKTIFEDQTPPISVPVELIQHYFAAFEHDNKDNDIPVFGFEEWLNATSQRDPHLALDATEIYLDYAKRTKQQLFDTRNQLTQLMTRLFSEAEEQEECDNGAMLNRVIMVQDSLLSLGVNSVNDWLTAAERP